MAKVPPLKLMALIARVPPLFIVIEALVPKVMEAVLDVEDSEFWGLSTPSMAVIVQVEVKLEIFFVVGDMREWKLHAASVGNGKNKKMIKILKNKNRFISFMISVPR